MKTQGEIKKALDELREIRPNVRPTTGFGESNLDALDAQIKVLEEAMDEDEIWREWPEEIEDERVRLCALDAWRWVKGEGDIENLAADWPLKRDK